MTLAEAVSADLEKMTFAGILTATETQPEMRVLFIPGIPQPAGSKKAFVIKRKGGALGAVVVDDAKKSRPWKSHVSAMAADAWRAHEPLTGPVGLGVTFVMPRPKSHFGSKKGVAYLKPNAPKYHTSKPDRTKLLRCLEDALTGIVWKDDSAVVTGPTVKEYGDRPGVHVSVWRAE